RCPGRCDSIVSHPGLSTSTSTAIIASPIFRLPPEPTAIYPLSLHDALPICSCRRARWPSPPSSSSSRAPPAPWCRLPSSGCGPRSEEHTSELQSRENLVCRLLLEKKKKQIISNLGHEGLARGPETARSHSAH